ncbi:malate synthase A [Kineococcus sp. SYSU DK004]|uniref:malate synthase A n=1 Tax=Kineococcus sp. SYSU DK004 TaxID=3383125 RepID=UPI003D7E3712
MRRTDVEVLGELRPRYREVLTPDALALVALLHDAFAGRRADLLAQRQRRTERLLSGEERLGFRPETRHVREDPRWRVPPPAPGLERRHVEITGPPTRAMTVNALNSGADVWMADFEDATAPTWANVVEGQLNLLDALDRRIDFTTPEGREYRLGEHLPTIVVRPRGWHLVDKHVRVRGASVAGALLDAGLYLFHGARRQVAAGRGPYFYLPKLESAAEARLWHDVFRCAEEALDLPRGTVRATVLVETLPLAFEAEEVLHALGPYAAGLNAGRWDYLFSVVKNRRTDPAAALPDRSRLTMTVPFMRAYTGLLVRTCHRRGAVAIGGMAAAVPSKKDPAATERALAAVRADKDREARDGFDGSWVAHPALVSTARAAFDAVLGGADDQRHRLREDVHVDADDLLDLSGVPGGATEEGLRADLRVCLHYLQAWLGGAGAVAVDGLMEDAATVEISRSQVWTWLRHGTVLEDGRAVVPRLVQRVLDEEFGRARGELAGVPGAAERLERARALVEEAVLGEEFPAFVTSAAYVRHLVERRPAPVTVVLPGPAGERSPAPAPVAATA